MVVTDKSGNPVTDLTKDDFAILENNHRRCASLENRAVATANYTRYATDRKSHSRFRVCPHFEGVRLLWQMEYAVLEDPMLHRLNHCHKLYVSFAPLFA